MAFKDSESRSKLTIGECEGSSRLKQYGDYFDPTRLVPEAISSKPSKELERPEKKLR
ncbi:hypothetical protein AIN02nite_17490 [Acetobacter indonesiensis]|uniref:Uncharacterized protein n=1 Tax=Acetobacter indonesiensis TaxID=104101 RepID=A0A6N3T702_9PROT|nr:hypothetical protein Abin_053_107 [Acetobacter indonesiensis]GEN03724.1 hypothetical protein AIN02nite_17490 [Acetobacter indonesiensis]